MVLNHFLHLFHGHIILKIVSSKIFQLEIFSHLIFVYRKCITMNNLILCSNNDEIDVFTIPTVVNDSNVVKRHIKISNKIEQIRVLYESNTRSILSVKSENSETKIYQFNAKETTSEWDFNELNIQIKSNGFYSVVTDKNLAGQQILEASASEEKLNFYVSNINEQTLSNTRSYSVELPETMGGIQYLSYSTVKHTQLVTLRMEDASLLVIKLAENGGKKSIQLCYISRRWACELQFLIELASHTSLILLVVMTGELRV
jgi:hypothetical protein